ncbi:MarR family winged helix-turn-helix transcriptional regulator [Glutamicibacter arilaitensis]|uniref:MarR family winged helix-turn-helix transcriptional regulator n=1 Tax=Glutamicibacter arilaitensis TaxID=256701 RepID=UPI0038506623
MARSKEHRNSLDGGIEDEDITLLIGKVRALALKITDVKLKRHGIDLKHYAILSALDPSEAPSQKELADYLNVVPRRISPQLKSLEASGLIVRGKGSDRRSHSIELTETGREMLTVCQGVVADAEAEYLRPLTGEERDDFRDMLLAIARSSALDYNLVS